VLKRQRRHKGSLARADVELTERQRQVLPLIAASKTNAEIGEALGISLDGAKWHVSEILSKLDVATREETAAWWRGRQSPGRRLIRGLHALLSPILFRKALLAGIAAATMVIAGGVFVGVRLLARQPDQELPRSSTFGQVIDRPAFNQLKMATASVGWGRSQNGPAFTIIHTEDGGRTWRDVSPAIAKTDVREAFFVDPQHAWVLASDSTPATPGLGTRILRTADAGRTWNAAQVRGALTSTTSQLTFVDVQHGWFVTNSGGGVIYRTSDGGRSWREISSSPGTNSKPALPADCRGVALSFVNPNRGFASEICGGGPAFLFRSEDGGASWQLQTLPRADNATEPASTGTVLTPTFPTTSDGFLGLWDPLPADALSWEDARLRGIYATHDGGRTWQPLQMGPNVMLGLGDVFFLDPLHGWLADPAHSFRTIDGGQTWEELPGPSPFPLQFVSPTEGFGFQIADQAGLPQLAHSTDGGETWQPAAP
jgi:photosystem II stability/assembly factor-like uncharacterized protein/DNA-binding CsgD family transcriptional regulator